MLSPEDWETSSASEPVTDCFHRCWGAARWLSDEVPPRFCLRSLWEGGQAAPAKRTSEVRQGRAGYNALSQVRPLAPVRGRPHLGVVSHLPRPRVGQTLKQSSLKFRAGFIEPMLCLAGAPYGFSANRGGRESQGRVFARDRSRPGSGARRVRFVEPAGQRRQSSARRWLRASLHIAAPGRDTDTRIARFGRLSARDRSQARASLRSGITARSTASILKQDNLKFRARFVEPMLCVVVKELSEGPGWEYELKLDGYCALGLKSDGHARLYSRNGKDF